MAVFDQPCAFRADPGRATRRPCRDGDGRRGEPEVGWVLEADALDPGATALVVLVLQPLPSADGWEGGAPCEYYLG